MTTKITIPKPCTENWETMKIGLNSRFCDNCEKDVVDFTNKDRQQILEYLLSNYNKKVCGRFYRSQLDFSTSDFMITISALTKQSNNTNLSFYLLAIGSLILAGCNNNLQEAKNSHSDTTSTPTIINSAIQDTQRYVNKAEEINSNTLNKSKQDNEAIQHIIKPADISDNTSCKLKLVDKTFQNSSDDNSRDIMYGEPATTSGDSSYDSGPFVSVEFMPEFKGGIDSLSSFIKQNLIYPDWEKKNKIQGRVIVSFVVDKNGKIQSPEILRSVEGSKNFDNEVLRMINSMPLWIPGRSNRKNVDVQFTLPIHFKYE